MARLQYLIVERDWSQDSYGHAASWRGDQGWQMHDGLRAHVAQMLASYGADVFRVSTDPDGDDLSTGVHGLGSGVMFEAIDMPHGVRLSKGHLASMVGTLGEKPEDFRPLLVGLFQANNLAVAAGLQEAADAYGTAEAARRYWEGKPDLYSTAFTDAGRATAWILQEGHGGAAADEAAKKVQAELVADALSLVSEMPFVPSIENEWLKLGYGEAKSWTLDQVKDVPADARSRFAQADQDARVGMEHAALDQLVRAEYISADASTNAYPGGPPPEHVIRRDEHGRPVGLDYDSEDFQEWYAKSPVRTIVTESVINTYASAFASFS